MSHAIDNVDAVYCSDAVPEGCQPLRGTRTTPAGVNYQVGGEGFRAPVLVAMDERHTGNAPALLAGVQAIDFASVKKAHIGTGLDETTHVLFEKRATCGVALRRHWGRSFPAASIIPLHLV